MSAQRITNPYRCAQWAVDLLERISLPPNPVNIGLWSTRASGQNEALTKALEPLEDDPAAATPGVLNDLYIEHLMADAGAALEIGERLSSQLDRAAEALSQADGGAAKFDAVLDGAASVLDAPVEGGALRGLVTSLVTATSQMRAHAKKLEQELAETNGAVRSLRDDLKRVRAEALTDGLTGLANRKRFDGFLEQARVAAMHQRAPLSLIMCDIDHFKSVNDKWGHATGDHVIRFVATVLQQCAGDEHLVARYGGEEMVVVAPGATLEAAATIAETVRATIAGKELTRRVTKNGETTRVRLGRVTVSFGVAELLPREARVSFIERADAALYESKTSGRDRVSCANPGKAG
jgi:diguanylate cyclase